jgi:hypothetical protein
MEYQSQGILFNATNSHMRSIASTPPRADAENVKERGALLAAESGARNSTSSVARKNGATPTELDGHVDR